MTDKELATYESVNAILMIIGDFLHKVDHYREHIYDNLDSIIESLFEVLRAVYKDN